MAEETTLTTQDATIENPIEITAESSTTQPGDKAGEKTLSFSQDDYNKFMAQERNAGKRSVMKQFGVTDEKDLPSVTARFNAFIEAEAKAEAEKPEIERLRGELESAKSIETKYAEAAAKNEAYEQERLVLQYGFSKKQDETLGDYNDRLQDVIALINRRMTDEKDFEQAAADYFKKNPLTDNAPTEPKPELKLPTAGTPGMPPAQSEVDSLKAQYQKAASLRNTAEMSRLTRLAKEKKIKLF